MTLKRYGKKSGPAHSKPFQTDLPAKTAESILILAAEYEKPDWLTAIRRFSFNSAIWFYLDNQKLKPESKTSCCINYPATGISIMKSGTAYVNQKKQL